MLKYILLLGLAVVLTSTTFVLGALPMRVVRRAYGRSAFWGGFAILAIVVAFAGIPLYAVFLSALAILVGVYAEVEEHGGSLFISGLAGTLTAIGATALGGGLWLQRSKLRLGDEIRAQVSLLLDQMTKINPNTVFNVDSIMQQLPSMVVIALICSLAISLVGEARMLLWMGSPLAGKALAERNRLNMFRAPDAFIWLAICSIFGAFVRHGSTVAEIVSVNVLNVLVVVFFFQGMAIVAHAFRAFKISAFWRSLWYIVFVLQLFLIVSLVGFADFWFEFRERLTRKPAATNKGF